MSKELDDAAENYLRETVEGWDDIPVIPSYDMDVFKAGARWQEERYKWELKAAIDIGNGFREELIEVKKELQESKEAHSNALLGGSELIEQLAKAKTDIVRLKEEIQTCYDVINNDESINALIPFKALKRNVDDRDAEIARLCKALEIIADDIDADTHVSKKRIALEALKGEKK